MAGRWSPTASTTRLLPIGEGKAKPGMEQPLPRLGAVDRAFRHGVLRRRRFPDWRGSLFVGALKDELLVRLELDGDRVVREERLLEGEIGRIRDVRVGPDGLHLPPERRGRGRRLAAGADAGDADATAPDLGAAGPEARRQRSGAGAGRGRGLAVRDAPAGLPADRAADQPPARRHAARHRPRPVRSAGPPWPELVITAGRRNEPVARWIQREAGGRERVPAGACRPALGAGRGLRPDRHHPAIRAAAASAHPAHRGAHAPGDARRALARCRRALAAAAGRPADAADRRHAGRPCRPLDLRRGQRRATLGRARSTPWRASWAARCWSRPARARPPT